MKFGRLCCETFYIFHLKFFETKARIYTICIWLLRNAAGIADWHREIRMHSRARRELKEHRITRITEKRGTRRRLDVARARTTAIRAVIR